MLQSLNAFSNRPSKPSIAVGRNQIQEVFNFLVKYVPGFEKSYISQTPHQIGIRETRHILCDYMITKEDVIEHKKFDDAICVSAFPMDIHSPDSASMEIDDENSAENQIFASLNTSTMDG